ncbi:hypothetical protein ES705_46093 [subsurface metagenome]
MDLVVSDLDIAPMTFDHDCSAVSHVKVVDDLKALNDDIALIVYIYHTIVPDPPAVQIVSPGTALSRASWILL